MEEQRKFKQLQTRLDALDYKFPFSIDSIGLIEAMLADLSSLNLSLQRCRKKQPDENSKLLSARIDSLQKENKKLNQELYRMTSTFAKEALKETSTSPRKGSLRLSVRSEKRVSQDAKANDYIEKLFSENTELKKQFRENEDRCQRLMIENKNLQDRLKMIESQNSNLKIELDVMINSAKEITNENRNTTEEYFGLKQVIGTYESKNIMMQNESNRLRIELQKSQELSKSLEEQVKGFNKDMSMLRHELEAVSAAKIKAGSQVESLQRQIQMLQNENLRLSGLRDEDRANCLNLEKKCEELEQECKGYDDRIKSFMRENHEFSEKIRERAEETRGKEGIIRTMEKELKEARGYISKFEESQTEMKIVKENLEEVRFENRKLKQEVDELKGDIKYKEEDTRQYRSYLEQANKDIEGLKKQLQEENLKVEGYNMSIRNFAYTEEQLKITRSQLEESMIRERDLHKEIDKTRIMLQKSEEKLSYTVKHSESIINLKGDVEQDNTKLQRTLSESLQRESVKVLEISKLDSRIQQYTSEIDELKRQLHIQTEEIYSLQKEVKSHKSMLTSEKDFIESQSSQITQLKEYISSLESIRNDSIKQIGKLQDIDNDKENIIHEIKEESASLKKQLLMSERICIEGVNAKESLMLQMESVKYELSKSNDELLTLKNTVKIYMNEIEDYKEKLLLLKESEENMKRNLRDSEIENSRLTELNHNLNLQSDDSKKTIFKLQNQLQERTMDCRTIDNSLKSCEEKCKMFDYEKTNLTSRVEECNREIRNKLEIIDNLTREIEEASVKYQQLSDNYEKLSRAHDYLNIDYKKVANKLTSAENMNESLRKQEETYIRSIKELEEELHESLRNLEITEYKRLELEKQSENIKKDFYTVKSLSRDLGINREDLERKIVSIESEKSFLETRCRAAEHEISSLKSQLDYEKQRTSEIEFKSLRDRESFRRTEHEEERARTFIASNSELVSELYKQIEAYKSDNLKLEMDYMKVVEEFSKTKQLLHQAEARIADFEIMRR